MIETGGKKMDMEEVEMVGSDGVERHRVDDARTERKRRKGKWADRD